MIKYSDIEVTGSLSVTGSLLLNGSEITALGSIPATASYAFTASTAENAVSSSYALTASYALNGGGGGTSVVITGSIPSSTEIGTLWWNENDGNTYVLVSASTWVPATNTVAGGQYGNTLTYTQETASLTWNVNHNLNTTTPLVTVWSGSTVIVPNDIIAINANNSQVVFTTPSVGSAVFSTGIGKESTELAATASYAVSSSYATTASFAETKKVTWCYARRIAFGNQTLNNTTNIEFDNVVADGITYSAGAFTLPPNGVYEIEGNVIASDLSRATYNFWDITNAAWIGSSSGFYSPSDIALLAGGSGPAKSFVVTGASSVQVALRTTSGGSQVIGTGDFATGVVAYVAIKKLN